MSKLLKNRIAITGSTGFVGKNLTKFFDKSDTNYTSIKKTSFQRKKIPLLSRCCCLIHLIGIGDETTEKSFDKINVEITKKAIMICKRSKIKKIIYLSGLGASKNSSSKYFVSKFKSEQIIKNSGLDYTIFRPSYIIGRDDYLTKNIQKQIKKKKILIPGSGTYILQPISIDDVCKVINIALNDKKFSKKIIDLVGPEKISFKKFLKNSARPNVVLSKMSFKKARNYAMTEKYFPYGIEDLNILSGNFQGNHQRLEKLSGLRFLKIRSI
ncbi:MAG: NAD-dependent epimerase/dehydratase family protein [Candidatus Nitrosopelagicus sp.]|jgi:NADH dehydrogenase|nr:NAD-dependent epimerase/dehydratase family protein [Candidatus Nitrosopelagicus sp.]